MYGRSSPAWSVALTLLCCGLPVLAAGGGEGERSSGAARECRLPAVAGAWYPDDARMLGVAVDQYLGSGKPGLEGKPIAIISPHAGYVYSGETAGKTYACLRGLKPARVVVIGVSHFEAPEAFWTDGVGSYRTPLGDVPVDQEALKKLAAAGIRSRGGHALREHSIEAQLPFLQRVLDGQWKLVPLLSGRATSTDITRTAKALTTILDDRTVVCVSSDFTHYGAAYGYVPFTGSDDEVGKKLSELDTGAADLIAAKDAEGFASYLAHTGATICGRDGIELLLNILPKWAVGRTVDYTTSGDRTRDFRMSVGYVGMVFSVEGREDDLWGTSNKGEDKMTEAQGLTDAEKKTLLSLARATLQAAASQAKRPDASGFALSEALNQKRGAFVTLTVKGQLRGCIGYVEPIKPLYQAVMDNAANAALEDPRFSPVTPAEVRDIRIEISAMSPLEKISDITRIEIGRHGIMLTRGFFRGLLLPQVATEYGWNREEFLTQTCRKAGLPSDAWKDAGTKIEIFSAEVFHEGE